MMSGFQDAREAVELLGATNACLSHCQAPLVDKGVSLDDAAWEPHAASSFQELLVESCWVFGFPVFSVTAI